MIDLTGMTKEEIGSWLKENGEQAFRGKQIFQWIQNKYVTDFDQMQNLSKSLREFLKANSEITDPKIIREQISKRQDTAKLLIEFNDGATVELVIMLYRNSQSRDRQTVCISTQVGCGMACKFCSTGLSGFERNLTTGEIVAQVLLASRWCEEHDFGQISNVVYMGMGEPLLNYDAVVKSIGIINDELGRNIGGRRISVSTCGLIPQIERLSEEKLPITLAISLHAPNDVLRSEIMPVNKKYNVKNLVKAATRYSEVTGRRITYEYIMLSGVNDSTDCAMQLAKLLKGKMCNVNLIPANHVEETGFLPSKGADISAFAKVLNDMGIENATRIERGSDISAACGQLRRQTLQGR